MGVQYDRLERACGLPLYVHSRNRINFENL